VLPLCVGAPENRVALLQLADASSGAVYLFHLSRMNGTVTFFNYLITICS
jgi:hypothetical protein